MEAAKPLPRPKAEWERSYGVAVNGYALPYVVEGVVVEAILIGDAIIKGRRSMTQC